MDASQTSIAASKIPFSKIDQLSPTDRAYATGQENLRAFYKYAPRLASFGQVIEDKAKDSTDRSLLVKVLEKQYTGLDCDPFVNQNIQALLSPKTFTVTTAHQPSLFTGPLYYIFKIVSTLNLAEQLAAKHPEHHFVPVFVTGGEDHDFEEANHTYVFGKKIEWQNEEKGSVGAMSTASLGTVLAELKAILGESDRAVEIYQKIESAYTEHKLYSQATVALVNSIFGAHGLVVLNMNQADLKRRFIPFLEKELFERPSKKLVEETTQQLVDLGYKAQATPRAINLFYLEDQIRERIVWENDRFEVLNTTLTFSEEEMRKELQAHPERFSPNVVMRPIYQEVILPNLAYVGGGGELAYWLERKSQFAHFGVNFPVLLRRNSAMWIDKGLTKKRLKLGLSIPEIFGETESLIKLFIKKNALESLDFSEQKDQLKNIFADYQDVAQRIDPTLTKAIAAEEAKQQKVLDQLAGKIHRAEKQKHEVALNQLRGLKEKLFPGNGLQERKENFLPFYLKHGDDFIGTLRVVFNPFDPSFVILEEEA